MQARLCHTSCSERAVTKCKRGGYKVMVVRNTTRGILDATRAQLAQQGTAQHGIAQHGKAQLDTEQRSTAQHREQARISSQIHNPL